MKRALDRGGEKLVLANAAGSPIDSVRYKDDDPWPVSPDGYTASLERICPTAPGDLPENWQHCAEVGLDALLTDYPFELRTTIRSSMKAKDK